MNPYVYAGLPELTKINMNLRHVVRAACLEYGVSMQAVLSPARDREIVDCRAAVFFTLIKLMDMPVAVAGALLNRHHSTAIHGYQSFMDLLHTNRIERKRYEIFLAKLAQDLRVKFENEYGYELQECA